MARVVVWLLALLVPAVVQCVEVSTQAYADVVIDMARQALNSEKPTSQTDGKIIFDLLDQVHARLDAQLSKDASEKAAKEQKLAEARDASLVALKKTLDTEFASAKTTYEVEVKQMDGVIMEADGRLAQSQEWLAQNRSQYEVAKKDLEENQARLVKKKLERSKVVAANAKALAAVKKIEDARFQDEKKGFTDAFNRESVIIKEAMQQSLASLDNEQALVAQIKVLLANLNKDKTPTDCNMALHGNYRSIDGSRSSGVYYIQPAGGVKVEVYCDMTTDGGGWTFVNEMSRSMTNTDDLAIENTNGYHRFVYDLNGMGYDEVMVERANDQWCDSWGQETGGRLIGKASIAISTDQKSVHYYSGAPPFKPGAKAWIKQSYAACKSDPASCWKTNNEEASDIDVKSIDATEKRVKFRLPLTPSGAKYLEVENLNAFLGLRVLGASQTLGGDNDQYSCYMSSTDSHGRASKYQQRVYVRKMLSTEVKTGPTAASGPPTIVAPAATASATGATGATGGSSYI